MPLHEIQVTKTARYYTIGEWSEKTRKVIFVLHGYGQLGEFFIQKFKELASENTLIVAPEALSRFYLNGFSGRVGATWMTKESRDTEILDYLNYLNKLLDTILLDLNPFDVEIELLGFSQGCATAARWFEVQSEAFQRLILWAGYFSEGISEVVSPSHFADKPLVYVYGKKDEILERANFDDFLKSLKQAVPSIEIIEFEGGHQINTKVLRQIF
ncbi:alpha/beta hydrolase [Flectobacillus roseus]